MMVFSSQLMSIMVRYTIIRLLCKPYRQYSTTFLPIRSATCCTVLEALLNKEMNWSFLALFTATTKKGIGVYSAFSFLGRRSEKCEEKGRTLCVVSLFEGLIKQQLMERPDS